MVQQAEPRPAALEKGWRVSPLTPALGAEVEGLDLSRSFSEADMAQLSELFHRYKCLFFRNQQALGGDDQVRRVAELALRPL